MRLAVVSYAAISTTRRCMSTSVSVRSAGCSSSQEARSRAGTDLRAWTSCSRVAVTYRSLSRAVSVPCSMSRAALTRRGPCSSGAPTSWVMTSMGSWSEKAATRSARPSAAIRSINWLAKRVTWRRMPRLSKRSRDSTTAPRSRSWTGPSVKLHTGTHATMGPNGVSAGTLPSRMSRQPRGSRANREGVRATSRFSRCPRTSQARSSPWTRTGATGPCSARSFSYRPAGSDAASGPSSRCSPPGAAAACAGHPGGGVGLVLTVPPWLLPGSAGSA